MKTENNIKHLLERYFEGETSREEEQILRDYFLKESVDSEFLPYKALFASLGKLAGNSLLLKDEFLDFEEHNNIIETPFHTHKHTKNFYRMGITLAGVAASLILLFFLFKPGMPANYVMINGVKYTDKETVSKTLETSVENVRLDLKEMFSDLNDLDLEDF